MTVWTWIGIAVLVWLALAALCAVGLAIAVARNERRLRRSETSAVVVDLPVVPAPRAAVDDEVAPVTRSANGLTSGEHDR